MVKRASKTRVVKAYLVYGKKLETDRSRYAPIVILNDNILSATARIHIISELRMLDRTATFDLCLYVWQRAYRKQYYNSSDFEITTGNLCNVFYGKPMYQSPFSQLDLMCGAASRLYVPMCTLPYHQWLISLWHSTNEMSDDALLNIVKEGLRRLC